MGDSVCRHQTLTDGLAQPGQLQARAIGDILQNVNCAVSVGAVCAFLDSEGVSYETAPSGEGRAPDEVAAAARAFTVLVECWN